MPPHQGRGHRTRGDDKRLGLEAPHDQREDERDDDRLDRVAVPLLRLRARFDRFGIGAAASCNVAEDRPICSCSSPRARSGALRPAPAIQSDAKRLPSSPIRRVLGVLAILSNVTNSARIGNPANGPPEDLERHKLAGQMDQERLADEHRPSHNRPFAPEPRIIGDRAIVAQNEELVVSELHSRPLPVGLPRGIGQRVRVIDVAIDPDRVGRCKAAANGELNRISAGRPVWTGSS